MFSYTATHIATDFDGNDGERRDWYAVKGDENLTEVGVVIGDDGRRIFLNESGAPIHDDRTVQGDPQMVAALGRAIDASRTAQMADR